MTPPEIDRMLSDSAAFQPGPDPSLVEAISRGIVPGLRPARPMISCWRLSAILVPGSVVLALLVSLLVGQYGLRSLSGFESALIFGELAVLLWLASRALFAEMVPASPRLTSPARLATWTALALMAVFLQLFPDRSTTGFVPRGLGCLTVGLLVAVPAGVLSALWLRRGLVLHPAAAGAAAGLVGALAGVFALELHCPFLQAPHLLWHVLVIPLAAAGGAGIGHVWRFRD
ncbi:MAG: NrsF family protein [Bryobacteraceae bacterium]